MFMNDVIVTKYKHNLNLYFEGLFPLFKFHKGLSKAIPWPFDFVSFFNVLEN